MGDGMRRLLTLIVLVSATWAFSDEKEDELIIQDLDFFENMEAVENLDAVQGVDETEGGDNESDK